MNKSQLAHSSEVGKRLNLSLPSLVRRANRFRLAGIFALICVAAALWLVEYSYRTLKDVVYERQSLRSAGVAIGALSDGMNKAELAQCKFLRTRDPEYLRLFNEAAEGMTHDIKQLEQEIPPSARTSVSFDVFQNQINQLLGDMLASMQLHLNDAPLAKEELRKTAVDPVLLKEFTANVAQMEDMFLERVVIKREEFDRLFTISRLMQVACLLTALLAFALYLIQTARINRENMRREEWLDQQKIQLEKQVRDRTERLTELASHLQRVIENERAHLARELHDELGALMTAAKLDVARLNALLPGASPHAAERLDHLDSTLSQGIALKRRIIESLRPSALQNLGLATALEILIREAQEASGLHIQAELEPLELDDTAEITIYRVVQESLTNICKYAQARHVTIILRTLKDGFIEISISDDGVGFDPTHLPLSTHGLVGMRHRLDACGGWLNIDSAPGYGTQILCFLPPSCQHSVSSEAE